MIHGPFLQAPPYAPAAEPGSSKGKHRKEPTNLLLPVDDVLRLHAALVCLTLFATVGAFVCSNCPPVRLLASRAAVFINAIPVVTAAVAWLLLGKTLTVAQAGWGPVVLFGVHLTNRPRSGSWF